MLTTLVILVLQFHSVVSPGAVNSITFELNDGVLSYRVERLGRPVIHSSALGFEIQGQRSLDRGFRVVSATSTGFDETWEQPWGEQRLIRNHYNELRVTLQETGARRCG